MVRAPCLCDGCSSPSALPGCCAACADGADCAHYAHLVAYLVEEFFVQSKGCALPASVGQATGSRLRLPSLPGLHLWQSESFLWFFLGTG